MNTVPEDITMSKPIVEMVTLAGEFCSYLESAENKSKKGILNFLQRMLPFLYFKGSLLPGVDVEYPDANERFVTEVDWENIFTVLRDKFGSDDEFWSLDPEYINETEPLKASIAENVADIYQDLKDFFWLFGKNTQAARENAVNDCKILFSNHWGIRVGHILGQVHLLLNNPETESEEELLSL
jgi:hypothetical protein